MKYIKKFESKQSGSNEDKYFTQADFDLIQDIFLDLEGSNQYDEHGGIKYLQFVPATEWTHTWNTIDDSKIAESVNWIMVTINLTKPGGHFDGLSIGSRKFITIDRNLIDHFFYPEPALIRRNVTITDYVKDSEELDEFFKDISTIDGDVKCPVFAIFDQTFDFKRTLTNIFLDKTRGLRYYGFICVAEIHYNQFINQDNKVTLYANIMFHIQKREKTITKKPT